MPRLLSLVGQSWDFCRKQPTMLQSAFIFVFLPTLVSSLLAEYQLANMETLRNRPEILVVMALTQLLCALLMLWGAACVLHVGKRMLQAKAGRTRTSLKIVRQQAAASFIPLLLTGILRNILTILWSVLLIIPGIVYFFRTAFYAVIVVCEGTAYRPALRQSIDLSHGRFWQIVGTVTGLGLLTLIPANLVGTVLTMMAEDLGIPAIVAAAIASGILSTLGLTLYLVAMIGAYNQFKPRGVISN